MARWKTAQLPIAVVDRHHFQTKLSFFFAMFRFLPTCAQRRRGGALSGGFDSCVERRLPNCLDGKMLRVVVRAQSRERYSRGRAGARVG